MALPGLLVDPAWLQKQANDPQVRIVDLRDAHAYEDEHIPGAIHAELAELGRTREGCENVLLPPHEFDALMHRLTLSDDDAVVCYDAHWGLASARFVWAFHHYGHRSVAVLNGGWDRWQEERLPTVRRTERARPQGAPAFESRLTADVSADYDWLHKHGIHDDVVMLDTRAQTEFDQGHLPGAINWDWFRAVPVGSWECSRDSDELRSDWAKLGVTPDREIVTYCRSGMRAAHTYMVLRHAGFPRVRLYDGSWQDWNSRSGNDGD